MNLVDSCGWLEFFSDGPNASYFEKALVNPATILIPTICIYEVFRKIMHTKGTAFALETVAQMEQGTVVTLDSDTAMLAAQLSIQHHFPMADSLILATAQYHHAVLWTQDEHFAKIKGVKYIQKSR